MPEIRSCVIESKPVLRGPGRPRDEEVRKRILNSAAQLLERLGFSEITVDSVAELSGASKATIYRWWPNKAAVLIDAFRDGAAHDLPIPQTGSLYGDVRQLVSQFGALVSGSRGRIYSAFIAAAQTDPEVAQAFRDIWIAPRRTEAKQTLRKYCQTGELAPDLDLDVALEILFAPLYYRLLTGWQPITDNYIDSLLATALNGFVHTLQPSPQRALSASSM